MGGLSLRYQIFRAFWFMDSHVMKRLCAPKPSRYEFWQIGSNMANRSDISQPLKSPNFPATGSTNSTPYFSAAICLSDR